MIALIYFFTIYGSTFNYNVDFKYFGSLVLFIAMSSTYYVWMLRRRVSILGVHIYEILVTIPMLALYAVKGTPTVLALWSMISTIVIYYMALIANRRPFRIFYAKLNISIRTLLFLSLFYVIYLISTLGLNLDYNLLLLDSVYDRRFTVEGRYNLFLSYSSSFVSKFMLPIVFVRALYERSKMLVAVCIFLFLLYFMTTSLKTVLFTPILLFVVHRLNGWKTIKLESSLQLVLIFICSVELIFLDFSLVGRRLLYIPSVLNNYYYEFFNDNWQYLSYGWYNPLIEYTYDLTPSRLISYRYWSDSTTSANNGLMSSGFMNFGFFGIFLYSIVLGVILGQGRFNDHYKYAGIYILLVFVFTTSFFVTSLLSHGVLLFLLTRRALVNHV